MNRYNLCMYTPHAANREATLGRSSCSFYSQNKRLHMLKSSSMSERGSTGISYPFELLMQQENILGTNWPHNRPSHAARPV